jgi:NAD(P)-dependent dehydrogenase (short-subunit alcohol dehydrogenase family)
LAAAEAYVVVNYASSKEGADRVVSEIAERGGKAFAAQGDISKPDDVKQLFEDVVREFGGLDVLVNNAGVYSFGPLENVNRLRSAAGKAPAPMEEVRLDTARSRSARGIGAVRRVQLQPDGGGWRGPTA